MRTEGAEFNASAAMSSGGVATTGPSGASAASPPDAPQHVEFERLPAVPTPACEYGANGKWIAQPRAHWAAIAASVLRKWEAGEGYAPDSCVYSVRTLCAPDLDDQPGDEVIAELRYRVPQLTSAEVPPARSCAAKERVEKGILVVLSPPHAERNWTFVALLGHTITGPEAEGGYSIAINHFVQLPNGGRGVFVHAINPGFSDEFEFVEGFERGSWSFRTLASRDVPPERRRQRQ